MNRYRFLRTVLLLVMAVIIVKLFTIQIVEYEDWSAKAAAQQTLQNVLPAKRGEIYMMDGAEPSPVVLNATVYTVIVDPMLADQKEISEKLTAIMGDKQIAKWDDVFANRARRYYIVGKNVERSAAEKIAEADFDGVWLQANTRRVYPEGTLGSTVLGFVNNDGLGQYGVEGALNETLAGKNGLLKTVKDINNVALSIGDDNVKIPAVDGENVVLTIDKSIQRNVEKIIEEQTRVVGFANISTLVMDPNNGRVLAMANYPGYDPANFGRVKSAADYINHVVEDPYEPASVCKTFAFAAGIDYGVMTPETTFYNTGSTTVDDWPISNAEQGPEVAGTQTMQIAFNYSLNTGTTQMLRWLGGSETDITELGRTRLYEYYHDKFGLGQATGIELIESAGTVQKPNAEIWGLNGTYANMTFGQNMQVTMLQTATAMASVVNGGKFYTPTIVAGKMVNDKFVENEPKAAARSTVSEATSATMRDMLYGTRRMWRANGTDAPGYYVGGKTGTAQIIKNGAYSLDETSATYIGVGGTEGELPTYLIMVRVWEDGKKAGGQAVALPVFNALKAYVQDALKVRPKA